MIKRLLLLMLLVVTSGLTMIAQNTLDLTKVEEPTLNETGIKKEGQNFIIYSNDSIITINKIVFANNGKDSKSLLIKIGDTEKVKMDNIKNDIPKDIKISPKEILTIKWGNSNWTFKMKEKTLLKTEKTKTEKKSTETQDGSNIFMYIVGGLVVFFIGFLVGGNRPRLCRLFKRNKKDNLELQEEGGLQNNNSINNNGSNEEKAEGNDDLSDEELENAVEGDRSNNENSNEESNGTTICIDPQIRN